MDNMMKDLTELCEILSRAINTSTEKIRGAGGKLSTGDIDYIDKLTHSLKSIKSVMAMEEAEMDDGDYSGRMYSRGYDRGSYRGSYNDGGSYAMGRGRGRYANRDSMGRYSSRDDGYSRGGNMADELREIAQNAPNEQVKQDIMRILDKM